MNDKIKKYVLPNIPYLFIFWCCLKLGTAYRMAPGADFGHKLTGIMQTTGPAFQNIAPGLNGMDWLIGIAGAVIIRLVVWNKAKKAKKFRRDLEYGSARWGTAADIKPFIDPDFDKNVILTQTERLTMDNRPKNPAHARNKNVLVIGGSGSGKTRFFVKPNLMQMHSSYLCTDPKGTVLIEVGQLLQRGGYDIKIFNTVNFSKSMKYNPFAYIYSEKDILKLVNTIISNTKGEGEKASEDFWIKAEKLYYTALIGYIFYEGREDEKNFITFLDMINASDAREDDEEVRPDRVLPEAELRCCPAW